MSGKPLSTNNVAASLPQLKCGKGIWADIDNDGDQDLLLFGLAGADLGSLDPVLQIYKTTGSDLVETDLIPSAVVASVSMALVHNCGFAQFADLDGVCSVSHRTLLIIIIKNFPSFLLLRKMFALLNFLDQSSHK